MVERVGHRDGAAGVVVGIFGRKRQVFGRVGGGEQLGDVARVVVGRRVEVLGVAVHRAGFEQDARRVGVGLGGYVGRVCVAEDGFGVANIAACVVVDDY